MHDPYVYYEGEKGSRKGAGTAFYLSSTLSTADSQSESLSTVYKWTYFLRATEKVLYNTTSMIQDLNEEIAGIDCMMRWLSIALHVL
jgi:hypothetical protein